ncbi:MAG: transcriptional regulator [Planctomycetes bacterium]|nr:transcriptional regulator [Planctomycetota bacterium]
MGAEPREQRGPDLRKLTGAARPGGFDKLIHEQLRLGMVSALAVNEVLTFTELKDALGATDGNLSVHARKLEDAGYVSCKKTFRDRTPCTEYRLTARGRKVLAQYLDHMEALIRAARGE